MKHLILVLMAFILSGCSTLANLDKSVVVNCDGLFPVYDLPYTGSPKYVYIKLDKMRQTQYKTTYRYAHNNMNLKIHGGWINANSIKELQCLSE